MRHLRPVSILLLLACNGSPPDDVSDDTTDSEDTEGDSGDDSGEPELPELSFPASSIWYQDVSAAAKHTQSDAVIGWMSQDGNSFEPNNELRMTLGIAVLETEDPSTLRPFVKNGSFYDGDCDFGRVPVPPGGSLEDEPDYHCATDGDCHLIVHYKPTNLLFEMWRADIPGGAYDSPVFNGGCTAVWDLERDYGWNTSTGLDYDKMGRGNECTSADAAGYPIAPLLFTPEELDAGEIKHALRFILPNRNIRDNIYVAPSTHSTGPTAGPSTAPPYGAQFRLKPQAALEAAHPGVDFSALPKGARVIVTALQTYGMFLSDGGSIALTGGTDRHSAVKYCDHDTYAYCDEDPNRLLHEHDLKFLRVSDFEMLDNGGPERNWGGNCALLYSYDDVSVAVSEN